MGKGQSRRRAGPLMVNIEAQIGATHNPTFPLSSPMLNEKKSNESNRSGLMAPHHNLFSSPDPSISAFTDSSCEGSSEQDGSHLRDWTRMQRGNRTGVGHELSIPQKRKNATGLHLVTDFSRPTGNKIVNFNQVSVRQVEQNKARAVSVVSQRGIQIYPSPPKGVSHENSLVSQPSAGSRRRKRDPPQFSSRSRAFDHDDCPASAKSIVIGLCVPENELASHHDLMYRASNLTTPATPAIVLTPPEVVDSPLRQHIAGLMIPQQSRRPVSSMYSTVICHDSPTDDAVPPVPPLPPHSQTFRTNNPFRNLPPDQGDASFDDSEGPQRYSEDSREHILSNGHLTPRHKSQGWWNLLMSPMLSRASSLASRKGQDHDADAPPVPRITSKKEKRMPLSDTYSNSSPETPHRPGLARVDSTSSRWTEWEDERQRVAQLQNHIPIAQHQPSSRLEIHQSAPQDSMARSGGSAASEYYHTGAVGQRAGIGYFDCVDHLCMHHLPQIRSIYDAEGGAEVVLGQRTVRSAQKSDGNIVSDSLSRRDTSKDANNDLITPIDSDDECEELPFSDKKPPIVSKTPLTPILESDSEPDELSPNIRKANTAAVVRAKALGSPESANTPFPAYSSPRGNRDIPNIAAVMPSSPRSQVDSANERSSAPQRTAAPLSTPQMLQYHQPISEPQRMFITNQTIYPDLPTRPVIAPVTIFDLRPDNRQRERVEERRAQNEKEDARARKIGGLWRGRGCMPNNGCFGRGGPEGRKKRRWLMCIAATLLTVVIVCIVLAATLHRGGDTPIQSQWLNLTGYPPMPTGISTIARPSLVWSENRCVTPTTMWSCTLPKEDQASVAPNDPNQPNLRFQISFQNGTVPTNMTIPTTKRSTIPSAGGFFLPNPSPPSQPDQIFLGNTTDNVTTPFDGERTPFFITLMSASPVLPSPYNNSQNLLARDLQNSIPGPAIASDGTAAPASLLPTTPYPISQPIKLYNRGHQDEHFGFYMYYDKSIYLANVAISNTTAANSLQPNSDVDQNGGSLKSLANVRCTFSQTRFLVKMFTNPAFGATILPRVQNLTVATPKTAANSSATDFSQPGSFPYPTTIVLDRHGGSLNSKLTYCYGMSGGVINATQKQLVFEDRAFGGVLVNPAPSIVADGSTFDANAGGVDGGTGGCECTWQNWS